MGFFDGLGSLVSAINPVAALGTAASMGSSILGYEGQKDANDTNLQIAREQMDYQTNAAQKQMDFQGDWAQKQMDFQNNLSNSAYQRQMSDMEKAGLNPILASGYSGASTPSGSAPSGAGYGGASATMQNEYGAGIDLGLDTLSTAADVNLKQKQAEVSKEELYRVRVMIDNVEAATALTNKQRQKVAEEVTKIANEAKYIATNEKGASFQNEYKRILSQFYSSNEMAAIAKEYNLDARVVKDVINSLNPVSLIKNLLKKGK